VVVGVKVDDNKQESLFQATKQRLAQHADITEFMRMYTTEAAKLVPDDSLDFIYVDARHDYCGVREDLREWWPKLRMGGILAGHDYLSAAEAAKGGQSWRQCMDGTCFP
jgi:predicted O-methyltransferase YrrM